MRQKSEIEKSIADCSGKIEALQSDVAKLTGELDEAKRGHVAMIAKTATMDHRPKSLSSQRSRITDLQNEIESTQLAIQALREELRGYEHEMELNEIHEHYVLPYKSKLSEFLSAVDQVRSSFDAMISNAKGLRSKIKDLIQIGNPLGHLSSLIARVDHDEDVLKALGFTWPVQELDLLLEFNTRENFMRNLQKDMTELTNLLGYADGHGRMMSMLMQDTTTKVHSGPVYTGRLTESYGVDTEGNPIKMGKIPSFGPMQKAAVQEALAKRKPGQPSSIRP